MSDMSDKEGVFEFEESSVQLPTIISPVLDEDAFDWLAENRDLLGLMLERARDARIVSGPPFVMQADPRHTLIVARVGHFRDYMADPGRIPTMLSGVQKGKNPDIDRGIREEERTSERATKVAKPEVESFLQTCIGKNSVEALLDSPVRRVLKPIVTRLPVTYEDEDGAKVTLLLIGQPDAVGYMAPNHYVVTERKSPTNLSRSPSRYEWAQARLYALSFTALKPGFEPSEWGYPKAKPIWEVAFTQEGKDVKRFRAADPEEFLVKDELALLGFMMGLRAQSSAPGRDQRAALSLPR